MLFALKSTFSSEIDKIPIDIKDLQGKAVSFIDAISMLRNSGCFLDVELSTQFNPNEKMLSFSSQDTSLVGVLKAITTPNNLIYEIGKDNVVTIYDTPARQSGAKLPYPLDCKIASLELKDVDVVEAIQAISLKNIHIFSTHFGKYPQKKFSISLKNCSVREALNQIAKAAGVNGWHVYPMLIKNGPNKGEIAVSVSFQTMVQVFNEAKSK